MAAADRDRAGAGDGRPLVIATIATTGLTFEPVSHTYRLEGREIPSVTQILSDNRLRADFRFVNPDVLERARRLGQAAHAAAHYYDEGSLDTATVAPEVQPYLDAWRLFVEERQVHMLQLEQLWADPLYLFAGTIDRVAEVDGIERAIILDIKTGEATGTNYQTAAYAHLAGLPLFTPRWSVQLHPERAVPYSVTPYSRTSDWRIFRAALELTHERAALGLAWREAA